MILCDPNLDRLDYSCTYDTSLSDWSRIRLQLTALVDDEEVCTLALQPQRCLRRRGLFGLREPSDQGTHLEGSIVAEAPEVELAKGEEPPEAEPLFTAYDGAVIGFRVDASYLLDPDDPEAPYPTCKAAYFEELHTVQLFAPYGELARLERTTPFEIQITYAPPDAEPAEDAEPLADGEEPPPPKPFASVMSVAWIEMYPSVMTKLRVAMDEMVASGEVQPEDPAAGVVEPSPRFSGIAPRELEDGSFLDSISLDEVAGFAFPRHELTPKSAARLVVLAKYGPLVDGQLMAGAGRSVPVPEHFAYRVPKSAAAPLSSTRLVMEVASTGGLEATIAHPMKIKELDSVPCNVEKTTNPCLLLMFDEVEQEDMILSIGATRTAAMPATEKAEMLAQVAFEVRNVYNPMKAEVEEVLAQLPRDVNNCFSFADVQRVVLQAHTARVARTRKAYPHLFEGAMKNIARPTACRVPNETKHAALQERQSEEALLSLYTSGIAEASEMGFPGLRQNVMLVRGEESLLRTEGEDKPRWDSECAVRKRDKAYIRPSKAVL